MTHKLSRPRSGTILLLGLALSVHGPLFSQKKQASQKFAAPSPSRVLIRHYQEGELLHYRMQGLNQGPQSTIRYHLRADGVVKKNQSGIFIEEFSWSDLRVNHQTDPLSPASQKFREDLSLSPQYKLSVPDLSKVQPILIGPITDLLTFYADALLAMNQPSLIHAGDHAYVKHGVPNSWADGNHFILAQDAIDFDITLKAIDAASHVATLVVRHVPPSHPRIELPAAWMQTPVSDSPNNWVQVEKMSSGKYAAEVGKETFTDEIKISTISGKIISASMDNPVNVLQRVCSDSSLESCGAPTRFQIKRQITLNEN
ncbi:MAG: hypothetical protein WA700_09185 [Acidobacteriaceae bacterium]